MRSKEGDIQKADHRLFTSGGFDDDWRSWGMKRKEYRNQSDAVLEAKG